MSSQTTKSANITALVGAIETGLREGRSVIDELHCQSIPPSMQEGLMALSEIRKLMNRLKRESRKNYNAGYAAGYKEAVIKIRPRKP